MKKLLTLKNIIWIAGTAASVYYWWRQRKGQTSQHSMNNNTGTNNMYSPANKPMYNSAM